ncbi:MAG TPA: preprotein translocase subunit SecG [Opitutus sp.]|nr:preprotein translocase subunit SecG [Opitutus sp.]
MNILLGILTFVLIVTSVFLVLVVLMQKAKNDGGLGAAMGGGMAEAAFGADTTNVLSKATINASILFFVLAFALYLGRIYQRTHMEPASDGLPTLSAPATPMQSAPAQSTPATPAPTPTP